MVGSIKSIAAEASQQGDISTADASSAFHTTATSSPSIGKRSSSLAAATSRETDTLPSSAGASLDAKRSTFESASELEKGMPLADAGKEKPKRSGRKLPSATTLIKYGTMLTGAYVIGLETAIYMTEREVKSLAEHQKPGNELQLNYLAQIANNTRQMAESLQAGSGTSLHAALAQVDVPNSNSTATAQPVQARAVVRDAIDGVG